MVSVALGLFESYAQKLQECETEIQRVMAKLKVHTKELGKGKKRSNAKNAPKFNVRERLLKVCGVDTTKIDGID
jgi:transposase